MFFGFELTLKICVGEIPSADGHAFACSERSEHAKRGCAQRASPVLIVVDTWDLTVALYAESCFECTVALDLEDPEHVQRFPVRWDVVREDGCPGIVAYAGVEFFLDGWAPVGRV